MVKETGDEASLPHMRNISDFLHNKTHMESSRPEQDSNGSDSHFRFSFSINKELLKFKMFYFLFFAGFGSTFPYLGIYFKQIGLNASYVGILAGVRPLIQFVSGPFWAVLADKYKARKFILLFSIFAWLIMTLLLAFPRPHNEICKLTNTSRPNIQIVGKNRNDLGNKKSIIPSIAFHGHIGEFSVLKACLPECSSTRDRSKRTLPQPSQARYYEVTYVIQRDQNELRDIFIVLLILIVVGEFLEAPSFIMTDTALLESLGDEGRHYGKTRLFGSLGYGVASFGIGAFLDTVHYQFCGHTLTNYLVIFYFFAVFLIIAFLFGLFFIKFKYKPVENPGKFKDVVMVFANLKYGSFLLIGWFMGFTHGGIMNFLNWFLEDLGATKLMMGIATACRCTAIIMGFFSSAFFIKYFGHMPIVFFALSAYVFSFFGYSVIPNPWWAIPIEAIQGVTYSMSWSACITYLGAVTPPNTAATMQGK